MMYMDVYRSIYMYDVYLKIDMYSYTSPLCLSWHQLIEHAFCTTWRVALPTRTGGGLSGTPSLNMFSLSLD